MRVEEEFLDRVYFFRSTPCFRYCQEVDLIKLASIAEARSVQKGTTLIRQGEPPRELLVIRRGSISCFTSSTITSQKQPDTKKPGKSIRFETDAEKEEVKEDSEDGDLRVSSIVKQSSGKGRWKGKEREREEEHSRQRRREREAMIESQGVESTTFLTELGTGSILGEYAIVNDALEPCSAIASADTSLYCFSRSALLSAKLLKGDILIALRQSSLLKEQLLRYRWNSGKEWEKSTIGGEDLMEDSFAVFGSSGAEGDVSLTGTMQPSSSVYVDNKEEARRKFLQSLKETSLKGTGYSPLPPAPSELSEKSGLKLRDSFLTIASREPTERRKRKPVPYLNRRGVVLIKAMPPGTTIEDVCLFFEEWGVHEEDVYLCSPSFKHSGVPIDAFVVLPSYKDAEQALSLDGHTILYKPVRVEMSSEVALQATRQKALRNEFSRLSFRGGGSSASLLSPSYNSSFMSSAPLLASAEPSFSPAALDSMWSNYKKVVDDRDGLNDRKMGRRPVTALEQPRLAGTVGFSKGTMSSGTLPSRA